MAALGVLVIKRCSKMEGGFCRFVKVKIILNMLENKEITFKLRLLMIENF